MAKWQIILILFCLVFFSLILAILLNAQPTKETKMSEEPKYHFKIFRREGIEMEGEFIERVFRFAETVKSYIVVYSKFSYGLGSVKGYVVTEEEPKIKFYEFWGETNKALVYWHDRLERFPEQLENIDKNK